MPISLVFELLALSLAWWLGLYLLSRDRDAPRARLGGMGLAVYALGLSADALAGQAPSPATAATLARWGWPLLLLPALFWFGSMIYMLPEDSAARRQFSRPASRLLPLVAILFYLLAAGTNLVVVSGEEGLQPGRWYTIFAGFFFVLLLSGLILLWRALPAARVRRPMSLAVLATLFFALGVGLFIVPFDWLPGWLLALSIGVDMVLLGLATAMLDAFEQGEALLPDFTRSLAFSASLAVLFGGQVVLVMVLATGLTFAMLALLLATLLTAIATQTFADPIQNGLDGLVFARFPRIRRTRAELRLVSSATSRSREILDPATISESQFARLTRRALSHMGDLPRLAASPLTRLELVQDRLAARGSDDNTLERAAELKALLAESIDRLKPRGQDDFGTTDEWRFYNALYFPYVAGLKPYSRRLAPDDLDSENQQALDWFRSQVPERTLYNWQTAAARLVAQDLLDQTHSLHKPG